jgi:hypothetical protein
MQDLIHPRTDPAPARYALPGAPILYVRDVFDSSLCKTLIGLYREHGGQDSGFMVERDGQTVGVVDHRLKRRSDFVFSDGEAFETLRSEVRARIKQVLLPRIKDVFQYQATRMERYLVACYESGREGFFGPHRDNTTPGTAHRKFACSINLNTEGFAGGGLRFPAFGPEVYRGETGAAVVFSCSLLHEALPVTGGGVRYVFLPFL